MIEMNYNDHAIKRLRDQESKQEEFDMEHSVGYLFGLVVGVLVGVADLSGIGRRHVSMDNTHQPETPQGEESD